MKWSFKKQETNLIEFSTDEFESVKFKCRIAIVDDEEISHVKRLRNDGYNIAEFADIENIDDFIRKKYHVVVLDIQGVGKNLSEKSEGWGILKYIKTECPHTVVIMFTGADWSITKYKDLADIADDFIGKDLEFLDFKSKLDSAIKKAFSLKYHFAIEKKKLEREISNANSLTEIENIIFKYGKDKSKTRAKLSKKYNSEILNIADNFLSIGESIFNLLK